MTLSDVSTLHPKIVSAVVTVETVRLALAIGQRGVLLPRVHAPHDPAMSPERASIL
jgi:hypothetical protein